MLEVCREAAAKELPVYLFGGSGSMLDRLTANLQQRIPGVTIAGARASQFRKLTSEEWDELVDEVRASGAQVMFVGLGCPRQEVFAYEIRDAVSIPVIAVGAAFSFHSGAAPQAPAVMQRWGLEWLFRLAQEPRRLWRRYLLLNPAYVALLTLQKLGVNLIGDDRLEPPVSQLLYG
jgi:exopolysaccharide biosynthesis WecB/TagA/CpsF family protein